MIGFLFWPVNTNLTFNLLRLAMHVIRKDVHVEPNNKGSGLTMHTVVAIALVVRQ